VGVGGDEDGVLPLGGGAVVFGADSPVVFGIDHAFARAGIDHRLDRKGHAGNHDGFNVVVMVGNFRRLMKGNANAVPDELIDDGAIARGGVIFDRLSDLPDWDAWLADGDSALEAFKANIDDALFLFRGGADDHHAGGIAEKSVDDAGSVDVEDVPFLKRPLVGDAVADHFIERGADGFGVRGLSVAEGSGDRIEVFVQFAGNFVEFKSGYPCTGFFAEKVEDFGGHLAGAVDLLDLLGSFDEDPVVRFIRFGH